ncbi:MAG: hypothetical protein WCF06_08000 [Nitrososphaeraceae archaeon]
MDVKQEWKFLNDLKILLPFRQLERSTDTAGSAKTEEQKQAPTQVSTISNKAIHDNERQDPLRVLKLRLAKGEIDKKEYQELYNAISS